MGTAHVCGLDVKKDVWCWGKNTDGVIANNLAVGQDYNLTKIGGLGKIVHVSSGPDFVCALNDVGEVYCWGNNSNGQAGSATDPNQSYVTTPQKVGGLPANIKVLDLGKNQACASDGGKDIWCWGGKFNPSFITAPTDHNPAKVQTSSHPVIELEISDYNICWRSKPTSGGFAYKCYGDNSYHQLGFKFGRAYGQASFNDNTAFPSLAVNKQGMCLIGSLTPNATTGGLVCAGDNRFGQMGGAMNPPATPPTTPIKNFKVPVYDAGLARSVHAFKDGFCALFATGGKVECWGNNAFGSHGTGLNTPTIRTFPDKGFTLPNIGTIFSEGYSNIGCALEVTGKVTCWGKGAPASTIPSLGAVNSEFGPWVLEPKDP